VQDTDRKLEGVVHKPLNDIQGSLCLTFCLHMKRLCRVQGIFGGNVHENKAAIPMVCLGVDLKYITLNLMHPFIFHARNVWWPDGHHLITRSKGSKYRIDGKGTVRKRESLILSHDQSSIRQGDSFCRSVMNADACPRKSLLQIVDESIDVIE
jgi:hypothetical protein